MKENIKIFAGEVFFSSSLSSDHWLTVTILENLQAEHFGLKLNKLEDVIKGSSEESSEKIV